MPIPDLPVTLGALRSSHFNELLSPERTLKEELRSNLLCKLEREETLFPGVMGYEDTVIPQVVNAVLSRHNFILLGLRGQAKTRLARMLTTLLDPYMPYIAGCEIKDHPLRPLCRHCRDKVATLKDETPIQWIAAADRYVEKLATPDVTIADTAPINTPAPVKTGGFVLKKPVIPPAAVSNGKVPVPSGRAPGT